MALQQPLPVAAQCLKRVGNATHPFGHAARLICHLDAPRNVWHHNVATICVRLRTSSSRGENGPFYGVMRNQVARRVFSPAHRARLPHPVRHANSAHEVAAWQLDGCDVVTPTHDAAHPRSAMRRYVIENTPVLALSTFFKSLFFIDDAHCIMACIMASQKPTKPTCRRLLLRARVCAVLMHVAGQRAHVTTRICFQRARSKLTYSLAQKFSASEHVIGAHFLLYRGHVHEVTTGKHLCMLCCIK